MAEPSCWTLEERSMATGSKSKQEPTFGALMGRPFVVVSTLFDTTKEEGLIAVMFAGGKEENKFSDSAARDLHRSTQKRIRG